MKQLKRFCIPCFIILMLFVLTACSDTTEIAETEVIDIDVFEVSEPVIEETILEVDALVSNPVEKSIVKETRVAEDVEEIEILETVEIKETKEIEDVVENIENVNETINTKIEIKKDVDLEPIEETEQIVVETKIEKKVLAPSVIEAKNPVKLISDISSVESFLSAPTVEDFGSYYEKALTLYNAIIQKESEITIEFTGVGTFDDMKSFIDVFETKVLNDLFWINKSVTSGAYLYFTCSPASIYEEIMMFNDFKNVVGSLGITESTEKKDAIVKINNWMVDYLSYKQGMNDPYIAFKNKIANCDGYARLFERFCKVIGVECTWESGYVKNNGSYGLHAWNKVKLEDSWYYIDVCWNDSSVKNKYLLSPVLWDNHTKDLKINVPFDTSSNLGNSITSENIQTILDIFVIPTPEDFGVNYEAALKIYNGLLSGEDSVKVEISDNDEEKDVYQVYDDFALKFKDKVLNNSMELMFEGISWFGDNGFIVATIDTGAMFERVDNVCRNIDVFRDVLSQMGIVNGMSQKEAIVKIINWMANNLEYDDYVSKNAVDALKTKVVDYRWYAEIFYYLCADIGIECEVIKGAYVINQQESSAYWNRIKIGNTWYYTDVWYYFVENYNNFADYEYFLSEKLWGNHKISQGY